MLAMERTESGGEEAEYWLRLASSDCGSFQWAGDRDPSMLLKLNSDS